MNRRIFLEHLLVAGAATGAAAVRAGEYEEYVRIPASGAGSMKPINEPAPDNDLTRRYEHGPQAAGQLMALTGRVMTVDREPVAGAEVMIWQACVNGMYDHINETRNDWRDPNFRHEGQTTTDDQGRYLFHTILPGAYPVTRRSDPGLGLVSFRAPHIHFTVNREGHEPFTSQIFFDLFDDINKFDLVLYKRSNEDQRLLTAHVEPAGAADTPALCQFDIVV